MGRDPHLFNYKFIAEIYDKRIEIGQALKNRNDFILRLAKKYGHGGILNLGCGTGSLGIHLAEDGFKVKGLDLSDYMLAIARKKQDKLAPEFKQNLEFLQGDMTKFSIPQKFSLVTISGAVFCHILEQKDQINCLKLVNHHLIDDGILCMDTIWPNMEKMIQHSNPEQKNLVFSQSLIIEPGNRRVDSYDELYYDLASQHLSSGYKSFSSLNTCRRGNSIVRIGNTMVLNGSCG